MRFLLVNLLILSGIATSFAQTPIDTIVTETGKRMVIFDDRSWEDIDKVPFNGVLNPSLQKYLATKNIVEPEPWRTETCHSLSPEKEKLYNFRDTIALRLNVNSDFVIPVQGHVTSTYKYRWRRYHQGVDLSLRTGDSVVSSWAGKVRYAQYNKGGYGNLVVVRHYNGLETYYAHLSKIKVKVDDEVNAGDLLGLGGTTGHSSGPHLHFEVRFYGMPINPEEFIDFEAQSLKKEEVLICNRTLRPAAKPTDMDTHIDVEQNLYSNTQYVTTVAKPAGTASSKSYYKVRSGDNLSKIAARHNTSVSRICNLNGIKETTILQVGRTLRVR